MILSRNTTVGGESLAYVAHHFLCFCVFLAFCFLPKPRVCVYLCVCSFIPPGFTLQKENLETLEAISSMAAALGVLPSDFTYAGIKDKRAVTHQNMVVKKVSPLRYRIPCATTKHRTAMLATF